MGYREVELCGSAADAFILAGLVYIFGTEAKILVKLGIADVQLFNPKDLPVFIG